MAFRLCHPSAPMQGNDPKLMLWRRLSGHVSQWPYTERGDSYLRYLVSFWLLPWTQTEKGDKGRRGWGDQEINSGDTHTYKHKLKNTNEDSRYLHAFRDLDSTWQAGKVKKLQAHWGTLYSTLPLYCLPTLVMSIYGYISYMHTSFRVCPVNSFSHLSCGSSQLLQNDPWSLGCFSN